MIDHAPGAFDERNGRRQRGVHIERCFIAPVRIDEEQPSVSHLTIELDEDAAGLAARLRCGAAQRGGERVLLSIDSVKPREDHELVRHLARSIREVW